jgi:hypothetical protein
LTVRGWAMMLSGFFNLNFFRRLDPCGAGAFMKALLALFSGIPRAVVNRNLRSLDH